MASELFHNKTRSSRAGLVFPVGRIHRLLKKGKYAERVGAGTVINKIIFTKN